LNSNIAQCICQKRYLEKGLSSAATFSADKTRLTHSTMYSRALEVVMCRKMLDVVFDDPVDSTSSGVEQVDIK